MNKAQRSELSKMSVMELVQLYRMKDDVCDCEDDCSCEEAHLLTPTGVELWPSDARTILIEIRDGLNKIPLIDRY